MQMMYRRAHPKRQQPAHVPASLALLIAAEFDERPWGIRGQRAVPRLEEQPQQLASLTPPAPNWEAEEAERREREAAQPEPPPPAPTIVELMERDGEIEWPAGPGPALHLEPLHPVKIPAPDWRTEQREVEARQEREKVEHARALLGLDEETPPRKPDYPASKRTALPVLEPEPGSLRPRVPKPPWKDDAAS